MQMRGFATARNKRHHLSRGSEVDLKGRVDASGLLAGARSLRTTAAGAGGTGDALVLGDGAFTGALTGRARAWKDC